MNEPLARVRGGAHAAVPHDSAVGHVTGAARYLDDVPTVPGTLEASLVLSPHAHARICRIDLSRALAAPGVREQLVKFSQFPDYRGPDAFAKQIREDSVFYRDLIEKVGIKVE